MESKYLIWSNQHGAWWGPNEKGYVQIIDFAGRYTKEQAEAIVKKSTVNGKLKTEVTNFLTGEIREVFDEVMVKEVEDE